MTDTFSRVERSRVMSLIRGQGTRPEVALGLLVRRVLEGYEVEERPASVPGKPDYVLPELQLAVFADGCFFHGCPKHLRMPSDHRDYWTGKIRRNVERDRRVNRDLRRQGFSVMRVWEHDLKSEEGLKRIQRRLKRRAAARPTRRVRGT